MLEVSSKTAKKASTKERRTPRAVTHVAATLVAKQVHGHKGASNGHFEFATKSSLQTVLSGRGLLSRRHARSSKTADRRTPLDPALTKSMTDLWKAAQKTSSFLWQHDGLNLVSNGQAMSQDCIRPSGKYFSRRGAQNNIASRCSANAKCDTFGIAGFVFFQMTAV